MSDERLDHYPLRAASNGTLYCDVDGEVWPCFAEQRRIRANLQHDVEEIRANLRNEATAARARGDVDAERAALDRLIAFEERTGLA